MNRQFEYRGYNFNTMVELHTKAERHPGGKVWHKILVNDTGLGCYYQTEEAEDTDLLDTIKRMESAAVEYVDRRETLLNPVVDQRLADIGFKCLQ